MEAEHVIDGRLSRSPHGERGLKFTALGADTTAHGRSPHGERGLKYELHVAASSHRLVALLMESVD